MLVSPKDYAESKQTVLSQLTAGLTVRYCEVSGQKRRARGVKDGDVGSYMPYTRGAVQLRVNLPSIDTIHPSVIAGAEGSYMPYTWGAV